MREIVGKQEEVKQEEVKQAKDVYIQWLVKGPNYHMRRFTFKPGARMNPHSHPWEHEIYVLQGKATVGIGESRYSVREGYYLYIPPDVPHWYRNDGDVDFIFICIIPNVES